jgi:tetratricopeptide (TPR) repeat protein
MVKSSYIWGALIALVLISGGYFFISKSYKDLTSAGNTAGTASTTSTDLGNGLVATGPAGSTIEIVDNTVQPPSLTESIKIDAKLAPEVQAALRTKEEALLKELKAEPKRVDLWLQLGVYRKMAGDYAGAKEAWQYVADTAPASAGYVAYGNLGNLYMDFLKDYPKAEASYKAAIKIKPDAIDYYRQLYMLYTSVYKTNTTAAADILAQGLKANPNNPDLLRLQSELRAKAQ